jgi:hypothetical protein
MVRSEKIYSPQAYLEAVTGKCYVISGEDDIEFIGIVLAQNDLTELWDFPLSEIDHIVKNKLNVVLVDCMVVNPETDQFEHQYRWFEVPEDFKEDNNED